MPVTWGRSSPWRPHFTLLTSVRAHVPYGAPQAPGSALQPVNLGGTVQPATDTLQVVPGTPEIAQRGGRGWTGGSPACGPPVSPGEALPAGTPRAPMPDPGPLNLRVALILVTDRGLLGGGDPPSFKSWNKSWNNLRSYHLSHFQGSSSGALDIHVVGHAPPPSVSRTFLICLHRHSVLMRLRPFRPGSGVRDSLCLPPAL